MVNIYCILVYFHGEVLAGDEDFEPVEPSIVDLVITKHGRHRVVTDVKTDPYTAPEHLNGYMFV